jgi:hypothetical protein
LSCFPIRSGRPSVVRIDLRANAFLSNIAQTDAPPACLVFSFAGWLPG